MDDYAAVTCAAESGGIDIRQVNRQILELTAGGHPGSDMLWRALGSGWRRYEG